MKEFVHNQYDEIVNIFGADDAMNIVDTLNEIFRGVYTLVISC